MLGKIPGMDGIGAATGKQLGGIDHLRQSIRDILTTPIGSRVMRRDYGSRLFELIDAPINRSTLLEIYAATAEAIAKWEPRFRLQKVVAASAAPGVVVLDMTGEYLPDGQVVTLDGIEVK
ncbi:GPW/gp25 family protein [Limnohabitans sp. MMS-10A-192]|jgi:phage baseplate assembly protein W|uniref:GPW/gp25 family protein n=1 Tax=Limnohabitans sp. MMS-10A-192 TaxID=1835769 RepID=UPI001E4FF505|nr:GPW/gp25 family protein [Limnohabitans sp. MMS-10A-192]